MLAVVRVLTLLGIDSRSRVTFPSVNGLDVANCLCRNVVILGGGVGPFVVCLTRLTIAYIRLRGTLGSIVTSVFSGF